MDWLLSGAVGRKPIGNCPAVAQACTPPFYPSPGIAIHPSGTAPSWSQNTNNMDNQIFSSESKPMWQHRYSAKGFPE